MITLKNYDKYSIEQLISHGEKVRWTMPAHPSAVKRRIYNMSTEMDMSFMQDVDVSDKRVLTVGSSGDQIIAYALLGSKDITVMDANVLTPFFARLKLSALQVLTREEFIDFFVDSKKEEFMNEKVYQEKIRQNLSPELVQFWDAMYEKKYHNRIFNLDPQQSEFPLYLSDNDKYLKARKLTSQIDLTFVFADISQFHEHMEGEYDIIDLSNIYTYVSKDKFDVSVEHMYPYLEENGLFKLHYGKSALKENFNLYGKECFILAVENVKDEVERGFFMWRNDAELKAEITSGKHI